MTEGDDSARSDVGGTLLRARSVRRSSEVQRPQDMQRPRDDNALRWGDSGLMPRSRPLRSEELTVYDAIVFDSRFTWLAQGLRSVELDEELSAGVFTLIAPIDSAFQGVAGAAGGWLFHPERVEERFDFFDHLVIEGVVELPKQESLLRQTLQGACLTFTSAAVICPTVTAPILGTIRCKNGVVHVVERLISPLLSEVYSRPRAVAS